MRDTRGTAGARGADTGTALLEAAKKVLHQKGYSGLSTREVASIRAKLESGDQRKRKETSRQYKIRRDDEQIGSLKEWDSGKVTLEVVLRYLRRLDEMTVMTKEIEFPAGVQTDDLRDLLKTFGIGGGVERGSNAAARGVGTTASPCCRAYIGGGEIADGICRDPHGSAAFGRAAQSSFRHARLGASTYPDPGAPGQ